MTDTTSELRQQLAAILIKWDMPTRQAALDDIMQLIAAQKQRWELYGRLHQTVELFQTGRISSVVYSAEHARITDDLATLDGVIGEAT